MSASPPAVQGSSNTSITIDAGPHPLPPSGQDHDRMETDEESERYESEGDDDDDVEPEEGQEPTQAASGIDVAPHSEDVVMDATQDHPPPPTEGTPGNAVDQASQTSPTEVHHFSVSATVSGLPSLTSIQLTVNDAILDSGILRQELDEARRLEPQSEASRGIVRVLDRQDPTRQQARREERGEDDDEGSDSDESMDDTDHPYWAHFKPDTSVPDESELSAIDEVEERSGTDHEHWEKTTFEALDDPEYVPSEVGRISWTVEGNHGTPEKPNREEIMRSPSVLIGGLYWNVKYYPRGNDGTDYMSVYIECSPKPYEENIKEKESSADSKIEEKIPVEEFVLPDTQSSGIVESGADASNSVAAVVPGEVHGTDTSEPPEVDMDMSLVLPPKDNEDDAEEVANEAPWAVAAQVACVVYNPTEPR